MNSKTLKRKGFTIVELVIVIAVIAILAAVLIPTFSGLIKKANQSADIQAVRQMNTILATNTDGSIKNVADAKNALDKENIDLDNYKPLTKDHYFYFTIAKNGTPTVIYTDASNKIVFPDIKAEDVPNQWMSLSGEVPMDSSYSRNEDKDNKTFTAEISSGNQLAHLLNTIESTYRKSDIETIEIKLTDDIDLMGSNEAFGLVEKNIVIDGGENKYTIKGLLGDTNATTGVYQGEDKKYGFALFNKVVGKEVTIKNVNISNVVIKDTSNSKKAFGHSGILFGNVTNANITIENVTIDNCTVYGGDKVGALIGSLDNSTANINSVTVTNTNLYGLGWTAKAIGYVTKNSSVNINTVNCDNVTTGINTAEWTKVWHAPDTNWLTTELVKIEDAKVYNDIHATNVYLPYQQNSDKVHPKHYEGILTNNLYWRAVWDTSRSDGSAVPTSSDESCTAIQA